MSPRTAAALRGDDAHSLREHLIASAARLIAEEGTAGLTVRGIARAAQVADGVLYNHFANKEELIALALEAYVRSVEEGLGGQLPEAGSGTVEQNLRTLVHRGFDLHIAILPAFAGLLSQPKVLSAYGSLVPSDVDPVPVRTALADYLGAEQRLGRLDDSASVEAAVTMISGAWHDLVLRGLLRGAVPGDRPGDALVDDLVRTVLIGIASR